MWEVLSRKQPFEGTYALDFLISEDIKMLVHIQSYLKLVRI